MTTTTLPTATSATTAPTPMKERDVVILSTDPRGSLQRECLLTVVNRLRTVGLDAWAVRARLNAGDAIVTELGWRFECLPEHQNRKWLPSPVYESKRPVSADDIKDAYLRLLGSLERPKQQALLEDFVGCLISKHNNHALVLSLTAEAWQSEALATGDQSDDGRGSMFAGLASALSWVADEFVVLLGRAIKQRSPEIRPFDFPEAWQRPPPTEAELEEQYLAQGGEQREEAGRE